MKITVNQLRKIIKEEVQRSLNEARYGEVEQEIELILTLAGNIKKQLKKSNKDDIGEKMYADVEKARELIRNVNGEIVGKVHERNPNLGWDISK